MRCAQPLTFTPQISQSFSLIQHLSYDTSLRGIAHSNKQLQVDWTCCPSQCLSFPCSGLEDRTGVSVRHSECDGRCIVDFPARAMAEINAGTTCKLWNHCT